MAGPSVIQRYPPGLLDLLGMQSTGDAPHTVSQEVSPSLELLSLYLADRLGVVTGTVSITGTGFLVGLSTTVPAGEMWMVYGLGWSSTPVTAGATVKGNGTIYRAGLGGSSSQVLPCSFSCAAAELIGMGLTFEAPYIMRPGDAVGVYITATTGVPSFNATCYAIRSVVRI